MESRTPRKRRRALIRIRRYGPVTQIRMARALAGRPLYWTCAYHVDGLLIDTGCRHTAGELVAALDGSELTQLVNTHSHEDHVGGNAAVEASFGVRAQIHPLGIERVRHPDEHLPLYRRVVWGKPAPYDPQPLGDRIATDRYAFQVLHAPGHSADQVVLFEEREGWLFSADLYLGERVKYLRRDERLDDSLESLRRVAALPVGRLFCGLGAVIDEGGAALRGKIAYWEEICRRVAELHEAGRSAAGIRRTVLGAEGFMHWISSGDFAMQYMVDQALSIVAGGSPHGPAGRSGRGGA